MAQAGTASGGSVDAEHDARRRKRIGRLSAIFLVILFLGVVTALSYRAGQRAGIKSLETAAVHRLDVFRASFFSPIERFENLPGVLAAHPALVSGLQQVDDKRKAAELNRFLEQLNAGIKSASVFVIDKKGLTVASSNWNTAESFIGKNFGFRPYFKDAMAGKTGRFYGIGSVTGVPGYFLSYGIKLRDQPLGVIVIKIDLDHIDQRWDAGNDQITVTDDSGIIFLSSNRDWKYRTTRALSPEVMGKLRETRQYASMLKPPIPASQDPIWPYPNVIRIAGADGRSQRYLMQSHELPQAKWTIVTYSSMAEVDATAFRYMLSGAGGAAFLVLLGLYIVQFTRRLKERAEARKAADIAHEKLEAKHRELEVLSDNLKTMAISDPLTGCHNRRYFIEVSSKIVGAAQRHHRRISVLMLDIDFFKKINDGYGHPAGDEVLKAVAAACKTTLRTPDFLVRFGGEEFVAILPDTSTDEARTVAERIRAAVESLKVPTEAGVIGVTVSIGIAEYMETENSIDKALARADAALYHAKRNGRNQVALYSPELEEKPDLAAV